MKKVTFGGILGLAKLGLRNYWFLIVWIVVCIFIFRGDYLHYKKAPQYYYLRRMLGLGVCISRGTAALLNVGIFLLVLPMGRSFLSVLRSFLPLWLNLLCNSFFPASKTMHLIMAVTILFTSVAHSVSHVANALNFSRNYIFSVPEVNMASYKGESPVILIFTSVPGITGVAMLLILAILSATSLKCVRTRQFEVFYYTHHCCVLFLLLLLIHPLSGVLKGVINVDSHPPGCRFKKTTTASGISGDNTSISDKSLRDSSSVDLTAEKSDSSGMVHPYPELSNEVFGYPEPSDEVFGYPEPFDEEFGYPEPSDEVFGYPEPSDEVFGYPEPSDEVFGYPEPTDEVLEYPEPSNEVSGYSKQYDKVPGYSEPSDEVFKYPEPTDEVFGYPEPSEEEFGYPDSAVSMYQYPELSDKRSKTESQTIRSSPEQFNDSSKITSMPKPNLDRLRHNQKRSRKYCLKPPLFVTIHSKSWLWVLLTSLYLLINCVIKHWRGQKEVEVLRIREFPANVLELTLRKRGFHCNPGQFILLRCPKAARYEWHPFTVAQCPTNKSGYFTILIRTKGNWCTKLRDQVVLAFLRPEHTNSILFQNLGNENDKSFSEYHKNYVRSSLRSNSDVEQSLDDKDTSEVEQNGYNLNSYLAFNVTNRCFNTLPAKVRYENERKSRLKIKSEKFNTLSTSFCPEEVYSMVTKCDSSRSYQNSVEKLKLNLKCQHRSNLRKSFITNLPNHSRLKKFSTTTAVVEDNKLLNTRINCVKSGYLCDGNQTSDLIRNPLNNVLNYNEEAHVLHSIHKNRNLSNTQYYNPNHRAASTYRLNHESNQSRLTHPNPNHHNRNHQNLKQCDPAMYQDPIHHHSSHRYSSHYNLRHLDTSYLATIPLVGACNASEVKCDSASSRSFNSSPEEHTSMRSKITSKNFHKRENHPQPQCEKFINGDFRSYIIDIETTQNSRALRLFFDGPFSSSNEAILSYPVVIGIAGGIGVTPLLASLNYIIKSGQANPRRLHVVWVMRELQLILPLAPFFQSLIESFWARKQEDRLELRFHCTSNPFPDHDSIESFQKQYPFLEARLHKGRPRWDDLFDVWKESYRRSEVGVFCCGPKSLNSQIGRYTLEALSQGLNFNYHHESFS